MHMKRRTLIALADASVWRAFAAAQRQAKIPVVGIIGAGSEASHAPWIAAMVRRLKELGRVDGSNVQIEYRWAKGISKTSSAEPATRSTASCVAGNPGDLPIQ